MNNWYNSGAGGTFRIYSGLSEGVCPGDETSIVGGDKNVYSTARGWGRTGTGGALAVEGVGAGDVAPAEGEAALGGCAEVDGVEVDVVGEAEVAGLAVAGAAEAGGGDGAAAAHEGHVVVVGDAGGRGVAAGRGGRGGPGGVARALVGQHVVGVRLRERGRARRAVAPARAQAREPAPHARALRAARRRRGRGPRARRPAQRGRHGAALAGRWWWRGRASRCRGALSNEIDVHPLFCAYFLAPASPVPGAGVSLFISLPFRFESHRAPLPAVLARPACRCRAFRTVPRPLRGPCCEL